MVTERCFGVAIVFGIGQGTLKESNKCLRVQSIEKDRLAEITRNAFAFIEMVSSNYCLDSLE